MTQNINILALDVETGGVNPGVDSLLEVGMVATFKDGTRARTFQSYIKEEQYHVTAGAMAVNKLNLAEVYEKGEDPYTVTQHMIEFINNSYPGGKDDYVLIGHNMALDKFMIKELFASVGEDMDAHMNYRFIDTSALIQAGKDMGIIPQEVSGSLHKFADYYNLPTGNTHTAVDDCWTTIFVYEKLKELFGGKA